MDINKKYYIKVEVVTPLSIGAGTEKDWLRGVDFIESGGKVYKLNPNKIIKSGLDISRLTSCIERKDFRGLSQLVGNKLQDVSDAIMDSPVSANEIKSFVKNQLSGKPIIPGSSIKGAVRSILFSHLRDAEESNEYVFGSSSDGDDFMRFIKFSDIDFSETQLVNTKIFNLQGRGEQWRGGWKHQLFDGTDDTFRPSGFNTVYESLMPHEVGYSTVMFSETFTTIDWNNFYNSLKIIKRDNWKEQQKADALMAKVSQKRYMMQQENPLRHLFGIINGHTRSYLEKEKAFFEKYTADKSDLIVDSINDLLDLIPDDNSSCLLKMSVGSGFHSITGDWKYGDYCNTGIWEHGINKGKKKYKSRKIAVWNGRFDLMGFVKISALNETDSNALQEQLHKEMLEHEAYILEMNERMEKERQEKEKREKEYAEQLNIYTSYAEQAQQAFENKNWENVLVYVEKALDIFPDKVETFKSLTDEAKLAIERLKNEKAIEEASLRELEERRMQNSVPLAEKLAGATKLPTLFGNLKTWMKQNGRETLLDDELVFLGNKVAEIFNFMKEKEKAEWKKKPAKWKDLRALAGEEFVDGLVGKL